MRALALLCLLVGCERATPAQPSRPTATRSRPAASAPAPAASPARPPPADTKPEKVYLSELAFERRPDRGPPRDRCGPLTTRGLADAQAMAANPARLRTPCCTLSTRCRGPVCAEELAARGGRPIVAADGEIDELLREYADAGATEALDATEALIVESESARHISIWRGRSAFTAGAAHANNHLTCASYDPVTGRRLRLRGYLDARAAAAAEQAARARLADEDSPGQWRFDADAFVIRDGQVRFCASGEETVNDGSALLL